MSNKSRSRSVQSAASSAWAHTGKVLTFPVRASVTPSATNAIAARSRADKHHLPDWIGVTLWCAFAWTMAALRVRLAAVRHEVFGLDATLAFLVAVVLPLLCVRPLLRNARRAWQWLRGASARRPAAQEQEPNVPTQRGLGFLRDLDDRILCALFIGSGSSLVAISVLRSHWGLELVFGFMLCVFGVRGLALHYLAAASRRRDSKTAIKPSPIE